jgi:sporulation protein YlmC with PRC-barrel domain
MPILKSTPAVAAFAALALAAGTAAADGSLSNNGGKAAQTAALSNDKVIVIDAPDLRRVNKDLTGPRFTSLIGEEIYSNSGKLIGEIEDFVMARGGHMYAVIDTSKGPIQKLLSMGDDEMVILPLRELRRAVKPGAESAANK